MKYRIGNGYDVHELAIGLKLIIGGIEIEHSKGFIAHSDGDVAIHALCDAILGALALGDIGKHFPDTALEYKGINSKILLKKVIDLMKSKGFKIENCDITIAAQEPKINPYIPKMREILSKTMEISFDDISIKATTTEKLGFVGREEGIEAYTVVLLSKDDKE